MWWITDLFWLVDWRRLLRALVEAVLALGAFAALAAAMTWPVAAHMDEVVVGGGELGGWLWRQWWHFQEIDAIGLSDEGPLDALRSVVGLGRYPETGNILDLVLLSYPLDRLLGFPWHHNLKVLVILSGNGLCGYALARSLTRSKVVALAAGAVAIANPLCVQDVDKTGLRQVILWWLLLYPIFLGRALRTGGRLDGIMAGVLFAASAAFYWFYGLFAAMFTVLFAGWHLLRERQPLRRTMRWALPAALAGAIGAAPFIVPYLTKGQDDPGKGGAVQLPELTFFLPFPAYDTIAEAPLRPQSYRENVLSSLHRTIDSGWPADYVVNPGHGALAFPVAAFAFGVLPAVFVRKARPWLLVWVVFWSGTLGPYLKIGAQKDTADVVRIGEYVVRLPYALMFQVVPGMSRMFAPYRLASVVVVASVALLAVVLDRAGEKRRALLGAVALLAIALQPFYRFDLGPVEAGAAGPAMWRVPMKVSGFRLPRWYADLDPDGWEGIIELPLDQQQDLVCAYQSVHRRKVYRSWASSPAIPPQLRRSGGGEPAKRLRWLAKPEPNKDPLETLFRAYSTDPLAADPAAFDAAALERLMVAGSYRWLVLHERGYFLVKPNEGTVLYRHVVRAFTAMLGIDPVETTEQESFDWPGKARDFPTGPAWVPWASQEVQLPTREMPTRYAMAIYDLAAWKAGRGG